MSTTTINKISICPHTLEYYVKLPEKNKFTFLYKLKTLFYRIKSILLSCYFDCQDVVVNSENSQIQCFRRYFPDKQSN